MVLLPRESLESLRSIQHQNNEDIAVNMLKKKNTVQTPGTALTRLDTEMSDILNSEDQRSYFDKWNDCRRVSDGYLHFKSIAEDNEKKKKEKKKKIQVSNRSFHKVPDLEEERKTADKFILESVPAKFRIVRSI